MFLSLTKATHKAVVFICVLKLHRLCYALDETSCWMQYSAFIFSFSQAFEDGMKQKQEQLQKLREKLLDLIKDHPNSPEAAKWKQMLADIGMLQGVVPRWPLGNLCSILSLLENVCH